MRPSRLLILTTALIMGAAMRVVPLEVAGAQSPSTAVLVPSNGATVSGTSVVLDASASGGSATQVQFELTGGSLTDSVIATGTLTYYGWIAEWDSTTVANGTYNLQSVATANGVSGTSAAITITVDNPPPSNTVVLPKSGATLDPSQGYAFDAVASPGVTQVTFYISGDGTVVSVAAAPTIYGWIYNVPATPPSCGIASPNCTAHSFPAEIQSVASYAGGVTGNGTPPPVSVTIIDYTPPGT